MGNQMFRKRFLATALVLGACSQQVAETHSDKQNNALVDAGTASVEVPLEKQTELAVEKIILAAKAKEAAGVYEAITPTAVIVDQHHFGLPPEEAEAQRLLLDSQFMVSFYEGTSEEQINRFLVENRLRVVGGAPKSGTILVVASGPDSPIAEDFNQPNEILLKRVLDANQRLKSDPNVETSAPDTAFGSMLSGEAVELTAASFEVD